MTDRPIIFSGPMVRALLAGRKTMTRRLAWAPWHLGALEFSSEELEDFDARGWCMSHKADGLDYVSKPSPWQKVKSGDRLWVRENWRPVGLLSECTGPSDVRFAASAGEAEWAISKWRPSIHMPRWASRLVLVVDAVKIERLQSISYQDVLSEGVPAERHHQPMLPEPHHVSMGAGCYLSCRAYFRLHVWDALHGSGAWDANPEIVALTFTVHQSNIDALKVAA